TEREVTVALVGLGRGAGTAPPAATPEPLGLATLPPSSREVDYPAIRAAHAGSALATPTEVETWRGTLPRPAPAGGALVALPAEPPPPAEPIEAVILRRGSTRTFGQ